MLAGGFKNYERACLDKASAVAILEFFTTAAGTRIVASRHFFFYDRRLLLGRLARILVGCCLLIGVSQGIFASVFLILLLRALLGRCFFYVLRFLYRNLAAHQGRNRFVVDLVDHFVEEFHTFKFEHQERIFLLVTCILHTLLQIVQGAEVLLPSIIDVVQ